MIVTTEDIDCTVEPLRPGEWPRAGAPSLVQRAFDLARKGDRTAAGFLYARYGDEVYECVRRTLTDQARAREATQCVFAFADTGQWVRPQLGTPRACLLDGARRLAHRAAENPSLRLSA
jgi:hypothetical protein